MCGCHQKYALHSDGRTCIGKLAPRTPSPHLPAGYTLLPTVPISQKEAEGKQEKAGVPRCQPSWTLTLGPTDLGPRPPQHLVQGRWSAGRRSMSVFAGPSAQGFPEVENPWPHLLGLVATVSSMSAHSSLESPEVSSEHSQWRVDGVHPRGARGMAALNCFSFPADGALAGLPPHLTAILIPSLPQGS